MNKIENLFYFDERITVRRKKKEVLIVLIYLFFFSPKQLKYVGAWIRSLRKGQTPIVNKKPWLTYRAINFLEIYLKPGMVSFEYGSGGTTLFMADRVKKHVAVEHHKAWYESVKSTLGKANLNNVEYLLIEPKPNKASNKNEYYRSTRERDVSFEKYVTAINAYPNNFFDVVIVDGRARMACVREAYAKVKHKGILILDNSVRPDYFEAFLFMKKRSRSVQNLFGLIGYETLLMQTTVWVVDKMANEKVLGY